MKKKEKKEEEENAVSRLIIVIAVVVDGQFDIDAVVGYCSLSQYFLPRLLFPPASSSSSSHAAKESCRMIWHKKKKKKKNKKKRRTVFSEKTFLSQNRISRTQIPDGIAWEPLNAALRRHGMAVGGSYGPYAGRVFRVGHMGSQADEALVTKGMQCLGEVLGELRGK